MGSTRIWGLSSTQDERQSYPRGHPRQHRPFIPTKACFKLNFEDPSGHWALKWEQSWTQRHQWPPAVAPGLQIQVSNLDILNLMEGTTPHCANFGGSLPKSPRQCIFASLQLILLKRCCLRTRLQVLNMQSRNIPYQIFFCFIHMIETPAMVLANPRKCVYSLINWKELDSHVAVQGIFWGFYRTQQLWQHKATLISACVAVSC